MRIYNAIWARRIQQEYGNYVDAEGTRWVVDWCHQLITPDGSTEEDHGYEVHKDMDAALAAWGLTYYVDPDAVLEEAADFIPVQAEEVQESDKVEE